MADENYSDAPKYVQIQNYILQKIESGEYAAGDFRDRACQTV